MKKKIVALTLMAAMLMIGLAGCGQKKSDKEDLEVKVGISKGSQMTPNLADRAETMVKKFYAEKGYYHTEVNVRQYKDESLPGYVKVEINVDRKEKTKVNAIYITGNEALNHNKINHAMKKTNDNNIINFFRTKKFVQEEFEKDKQAVIEKYNEIGYRDAFIVADSVVTCPTDSNKVDIYMTINEGKKYYFRNIQWVGNTVYPYETLNLVLGIKKGDIFNQKELNKRLNEDDDAVSKMYTDQGYLFFNVDPVEVKIDGDSIDFEMRMYEGKPATINEVNIVGNTRV